MENIDAVEYVMNKEGRVTYDDENKQMDKSIETNPDQEVILTDKDSATAQIDRPLDKDDEDFLF